MANPTTSSNVILSIAQTSQYVPEIWTREIQQPFDKVLQAKKLVQDRSGLAKGGGDIIRIPFTAAVNARAKSASTDIVFDSPEGSPIALNIDKHYYVGVKIEDIAKVQSMYDLKAAFMARMAEGLARQIDTDLLTVAYSNATTAVAGGATVDDADMIAVVNALDLYNTPMDSAYDQTGKTGLAVDNSGGLIASVYDMGIYFSQNTVTTHNVFFHKNAVNFAAQQAPKFEAQYMVKGLAWETALHTIYGVGMERAGSVVDVTRTTAA